MKRNNSKFNIASFAAVFLLLLLPLYVGAELPKHLVDVRILQEGVLPQNNSYRHSDSIVEWKGYGGAQAYICHTDCSGLIDALLAHSYGYSHATLRNWLGRADAKARNYFRVIGEQNGFARFYRINEILPGDFIAIKFLPWASDKGHDTGHIMVLNQLPQMLGQRAIEGRILTVWAIEVIDCSHGHGTTDTRYRDGRYWPGVGKGIAALYTDQSGVITGYSWTPSVNSTYNGGDRRPLDIGRLIIPK
jgi:hypothetical protein